METHISGSQAAATQQLNELTLLYRFSNTMLSTIRLNKLTHLILTALTSGTPPMFERAMLFLRNEKAGVLQGMLGVTTDTAEGLELAGGAENSLRADGTSVMRLLPDRGRVISVHWYVRSA